MSTLQMRKRSKEIELKTKSYFMGEGVVEIQDKRGGAGLRKECQAASSAVEIHRKQIRTSASPWSYDICIKHNGGLSGV